MRWRRSRRSKNIEDRRGRGGGMGRGVPGIPLPSGSRGFRFGGIGSIIILIIAFLLGANPFSMIDMLGDTSGGPQISVPDHRVPTGTPAGGVSGNLADDEQADFVAAILGDTEDVWSRIFSEYDQRYQPPRLVLFNNLVQSACGMASAAAGPFYCPGDQQVYIDLAFFRELQRLGAHGDFARAYVIAHEVGHHIQLLTGTERKVRDLRRRVSKREGNQLSVMMELQADCYAGMWAHHAHKQRQLLEEGDIEEGLNAAASIGDDRLQQMSGRGVHPDSFTHGSSEQRVEWFRTGLRSGRYETCDTFDPNAV